MKSGASSGRVLGAKNGLAAVAGVAAVALSLGVTVVDSGAGFEQAASASAQAAASRLSLCMGRG